LLNTPYDGLNKLAESAPAGAGGLIFLPYLFGERCPAADPFARGVFFGINRNTAPPHMARAVMEGVAFNIRAMFAEITPLVSVNEIYITGGGAKSRVWGQIIADIIGREISVQNIEEGPAFGAALIAAVGAGIYCGFEAAKAVFLKPVCTINPKQHEIYDRQYQLFNDLYAANAPLFKRLHE